MNDLLKFKSNYHSEGGEDGIIEKLMHEAKITHGYFIEFGAWDGMYLSNTCHLAEKGWGGVFIEAHPDRYRDLLKNYSAHSGIVCVNSMVMPIGTNSLSSIIDRTAYAKQNPTVLSIDIDSDDLAVWKGFENYRAFLVIIEYNPTIPADVSFQNPEGRQVGNSALAIYEHAQQLNYALVAQNSSNMFFVDRALLPASIHELDFLNTQKTNADRFFFGYDGTFYRQIAREDTIDFREEEIFQTPWANALTMQPVPRYFRVRWRKSRLIYITMLAWAATLLIITRPLTVISMVLYKRRKLGLYLNSLVGKSSQAEKKVITKLKE